MIRFHRIGQILGLFTALPCLGASAWAGGNGEYGAGRSLNVEAIAIFILFVTATLFITKWAAARTKTTSDFYAAGAGITAGQNGLAIAGDFLSAASFLGGVGLFFSFGFDTSIYTIGALFSWPIVLFLIAERLRNLGRYTFADVVAFRFETRAIRTLSAIGTLTVVAFYLTMQMVGAGKLIETLFGLPYIYAEIAVGCLMINYVAFGGMVATTWIQIIKACLLIGAATFMAFMVLWHFNFSPDTMFRSAIETHPKGRAIMGPGLLVKDPVTAFSLGLAFVFGTAGLPHILMRFFTVRDAKAARKSVFYATGLITYFYVLLWIIGIGAVSLVMNEPAFYTRAADGSIDKIGGLVGGVNMPAIHLAKIVGGSLFLGFISAVAFATILAVVAGLTLAGASAISHDLYACTLARGTASEQAELRLSKISAAVIGLLAIILGYLFEKQNIAFLAGLTFSIAASCNFPILFMSLYWKDMTTRGALAGGYIGLLSSLVMVILSPGVWVKTLGYTEAIFPYDNPALFSIPLAFLSIWIVSKFDTSRRAAVDRAGFEAQFVRSETGFGSSVCAAH